MLRIALGVIAGFFAWAILWFASEMLLAALLPDWFGAQQQAFQAAIENGDPFSPKTSFLLTHIACASLVSLAAGFLAALVAGESKRAPLVLGFLLLAIGLLKAAMSWQYVPLWYHVGFTAMLPPMAVVGGKLKPKPIASKKSA